LENEGFLDFYALAAFEYDYIAHKYIKCAFNCFLSEVKEKINNELKNSKTEINKLVTATLFSLNNKKSFFDLKSENFYRLITYYNLLFKNKNLVDNKLDKFLMENLKKRISSYIVIQFDSLIHANKLIKIIQEVFNQYDLQNDKMNSIILLKLNEFSGKKINLIDWLSNLLIKIKRTSLLDKTGFFNYKYEIFKKDKILVKLLNLCFNT
jgi:hypothetical protein